MYQKAILFSLLWTLSLGVLFGQCCSGGVPISSNLGLLSKTQGTFQAQLTYDYNSLRALLAGREVLEDGDRIRNTHSALLELAYDLRPAWSVSGLLTWVRQERLITGFNDQLNETVNTGLGDAIFMLRYNVFHKQENRNRDLFLGLGPKIPLGSNDNVDENGLLLPADLQPGTGSWDLVAWSFFTQSEIIRPTTQISAFATYRATSPAPRPNSNQEYEFGNELQVQLGISDRFLWGTTFIDPAIAIRYRDQGVDRVDGQIFPNSGAQYLFLVPNMTVSLGNTAGLRFAANLPVYRKIVGTQLATSYRISATLFFTFSKQNQNLIPIKQ